MKLRKFEGEIRVTFLKVRAPFFGPKTAELELAFSSVCSKEWEGIGSRWGSLGDGESIPKWAVQ